MPAAHAQPRFVPSRNTLILHRRLLETPVGGEVGYVELARLVGDAVSASFAALQSARRIAQTQNAAIFDTIRGQGLRRLTPDEVVAKGTMRRRGLRRAARRGILELDTLNRNGSNAPLPTEIERVATVSRIIYREVVHTTKESTFEGAAELAGDLDLNRAVTEFLRSGRRMKVVEETTVTTTATEE